MSFWSRLNEKKPISYKNFYSCNYTIINQSSIFFKKLNLMCLFFLSFDSVYIFSLETGEWMIFVINLHANICMDIYFVSVSFNAASFASWFNFSTRFQIDIYVISRYSLINYIVEFINWSNYQLKIRVLRNQMILFEKEDTFIIRRNI